MSQRSRPGAVTQRTPTPKEPIDRPRLARAIAELLAALPHPPSDPELAGTPDRVAAAFADELLDGYALDATTVLGRGSASSLKGVVAIRDLEAHGMCPHHLLPWRGAVDVAYRPGGRVAGLGRVVKLVDVFAHRLALQEEVAQQVASALVEGLGAKGAAVRIRAVHDCLALRGERRPEAIVDVVAEAGEAGAAVAAVLKRGDR